jgi:hypothetical protein
VSKSGAPASRALAADRQRTTLFPLHSCVAPGRRQSNSGREMVAFLMAVYGRCSAAGRSRPGIHTGTDVHALPVLRTVVYGLCSAAGRSRPGIHAGTDVRRIACDVCAAKAAEPILRNQESSAAGVPGMNAGPKTAHGRTRAVNRPQLNDCQNESIACARMYPASMPAWDGPSPNDGRERPCQPDSWLNRLRAFVIWNVVAQARRAGHAEPFVIGVS